jgi:hypothetical protein
MNMKQQTLRAIPRWTGVAAVAVVAALAATLPATRAAAAVPPAFSVQGVLRDGAGQLQTLAITVQASFYDAESGGNLLNPRPYVAKDVKAVNGLFTVAFSDPGLLSALASPPSGQLWLEITIGLELFPRQQVTPGIAALLCKSADDSAALGGVAASGYQRILGTPDCGPGKYMQRIDPDGRVTCGTDAGGSGARKSDRALAFDEQTATASGTALVSSSAVCQPGYTLLAGGCQVSDPMSQLVVESFPAGNAWRCTCRDSGAATVSCTAHARCLQN